MPIVLLGIVLLMSVVLTQVGVYFPVELLFSLHLPFWFTMAIGLLVTAWLLED